MLSINNVCKTFNGKQILNNITLNIQAGEVALLLGSSGGGKSTLLRILNNLESIDSGSIELDGKPLDLATVNKDHTVGMVFQQFNLFEHLTVEQNITLALERTQKKSATQARAIAHKLLAHYGLAGKENTYVNRLSGGQKQRVALARTLAVQPAIVCLDEPTSALDPYMSDSVAQTVTQLAHDNYTVLIASHDTRLIEKIDCTIYLMHNGTIVEHAQSKDFKQNPHTYTHINRFVSGNN